MITKADRLLVQGHECRVNELDRWDSGLISVERVDGEEIIAPDGNSFLTIYLGTDDQWRDKNYGWPNLPAWDVRNIVPYDLTKPLIVTASSGDKDTPARVIGHDDDGDLIIALEPGRDFTWMIVHAATGAYKKSPNDSGTKLVLKNREPVTRSISKEILVDGEYEAVTFTLVDDKVTAVALA